MDIFWRDVYINNESTMYCSESFYHPPSRKESEWRSPLPGVCLFGDGQGTWTLKSLSRQHLDTGKNQFTIGRGVFLKGNISLREEANSLEMYTWSNLSPICSAFDSNFIASFFVLATPGWPIPKLVTKVDTSRSVNGPYIQVCISNVGKMQLLILAEELTWIVTLRLLYRGLSRLEKTAFGSTLAALAPLRKFRM